MWAEIAHGGHVGRGEGAPDDRYGESVEAAREFIDGAGDALGDDPFALEAIEHAAARARRLRRRLLRGRVRAARSRRQARRSADLAAARAGRPHAADVVHDRHRLGRGHRRPRAARGRGGLPPAQGQARRRGRPRAAGGDPRRLRPAAAGRRQRGLDARGGARPAAGAGRARRRADRAAVPGRRARRVPRAARARRAASRSSSTRAATRCRDVADVAGYADGVNLKLAKTGGIREAVRMIHAARALGLVVMLGCMIESSLGISAAAQFASLCDFVDLDGHLLISDDPCRGARRSRTGASCSRSVPAWAWSRARERARRGLRRGVPAHVERQGRPRPDPLRRARGRRRRRLAARRAARRSRSCRTPPSRCRSSPRSPRPPRSARSASRSASRRPAASCRRSGRRRCSRRSRSGCTSRPGCTTSSAAIPTWSRRRRRAGSSCATCARVPAGLSTPSGAGLGVPARIVHTVGTRLRDRQDDGHARARGRRQGGRASARSSCRPGRSASRSRAGASPSTT